MLYKSLGSYPHIDTILQEVTKLIESVPFSEKIPNQLSLQVSTPDDNSNESWYKSIGRIDQGDRKIVEDDYRWIHPALRGTKIHDWVDWCSSLGSTIVRLRLMLIPGRTCYSIHKDPEPRIHLPVITNPSCMICFPDRGVMQHLSGGGQTYWVDTTNNHTAINCSLQNRIHLVGVTGARSN